MIIRKIKNKIGLQDFGYTNHENRQKWLKKTLSQLPKGLRILDAGAGELRYKPYCEHLTYVSQDFGQYNGKGNSKGLQTGVWDNTKLDIISDITSIPEKDNSFDAIMCIEVFEHLPDPISAIKEFSRLLKSGGKLIITAPFASITHFAPYHYYSGFNTYFYEKHLSNYGFKLDIIENNGTYFEFLAQEIRQRIPNPYSTTKVFVWDKMVKYLFLLLLKRLNKRQTNSDEIICFGYNILATKLENEI